MSRDAEITEFLAEAGCDGAVRRALDGDASARRYERIRWGENAAMLMDAPPESGLDLAPFVAVTDWLRSGGFSAPQIYAADTRAGLLLIEDLGDELLNTLCASAPTRAPDAYALAIGVLAELHDRAPPRFEAGWTPPYYDIEVMAREANLLVEWYAPAAGETLSQAAAQEYDALVRDHFAGVAAARDVAVYRDYHAENLVWLPERSGRARLGLLDYQDMLIGHAAYDLASLLEDARRDVDPDLRATMIARYAERRGLDRAQLTRDFDILSAQRNLKIMGLFTRLCRRDGKARYLELLPRVWRHLMHDLEEPALRPLRDWIGRHIPPPDATATERIREAAA